MEKLDTALRECFQARAQGPLLCRRHHASSCRAARCRCSVPPPNTKDNRDIPIKTKDSNSASESRPISPPPLSLSGKEEEEDEDEVAGQDAAGEGACGSAAGRWGGGGGKGVDAMCREGSNVGEVRGRKIKSAGANCKDVGTNWKGAGARSKLQAHGSLQAGDAEAERRHAEVQRGHVYAHADAERDPAFSSSHICCLQSACGTPLPRKVVTEGEEVVCVRGEEVRGEVLGGKGGVMSRFLGGEEVSGEATDDATSALHSHSHSQVPLVHSDTDGSRGSSSCGAEGGGGGGAGSAKELGRTRVRRQEVRAGGGGVAAAGARERVQGVRGGEADEGGGRERADVKAVDRISWYKRLVQGVGSDVTYFSI